MKHDDQNVDEVLKRNLRSTPQEEMEAAGRRVLAGLRLQPEPVGRDAVATPPRTRGYALMAAGLAAASVLAFVVLRMDWRDPTPVTPPREMGQAAANPPMVFTLQDGSIVEAQALSALGVEKAPDGERIRLNRGSIVVTAAPQRQGHLYVQTADLQVSVTGTVFFVSAEEKGSRAGVIEGKVRVQSGRSLRELLPGGQIATGFLEEYASLNDAFAWSQNASRHAALLLSELAKLQNAVVEMAPQVSSTAVGLAEPVAEPVVGRQAATPGQSVGFEVASIRPADPAQPRLVLMSRNGRELFPACSDGPVQIDPGRFSATDTTLYKLVRLAFGLRYSCFILNDSDLLSGGPAWVTTDRFDVQATIPPGMPAYTLQQLTAGEAPELQAMLRSLLAERFKLVVRRNMKEVRVYTIASTPDALKLAPSRADQPKNAAVMTIPDQNDEMVVRLIGNRMSMMDLAHLLEPVMHTPVLDKTGFDGDFSLDIRSAVPDTIGGVGFQIEQAGLVAATKPSIFSVLQEQLGLRLEAARGSVDAWIIEQAEKPSGN